MTPTYFVTVLAFLICFSCSKNNDSDEGIICTDIFVYGLNITLIDAETQNKITNNATNNVEVKVTEGNYKEIFKQFTGFDSFSGAGERPGTYVITVTSAKYKTFISDPITIETDGCHVISKVLEFNLQPK
ncbi:hypothetical protein [Aestuariibaculum sediminum]|uniref:Carboxypeptidase regulatory-like domain-containing protein n=1 Tax=Aestuariibaculum sediminum TaxID=2770637 RepID=A0A8J6U751_9FLAO|nr:hypothetical protein [Aestuariibaculum sediminum]MBD0831390.1 hypothetical protein [Aestuariibaculum sediminum]